MQDLFEKVCRLSKDEALIEKDKIGKREIRSFLDRRKKNLNEDDKRNIQWVATNLYQMIKRHIGITEEIREKFYEATKDKIYIREKRFDDIRNDIDMVEKKIYDDNKDYCLNIKEKELWAEKFYGELKEFIDKWIYVFETMDSLKFEDEENYQGIIKPERLLEDAIKKTEKAE